MKKEDVDQLIRHITKHLRLSPKTDEGDQGLLEAVSKYLSTPRQGMYFDLAAATDAFTNWSSAGRFGKPMFPDVKAILEKCWRSTVKTLKPYHITGAGGIPVGLRRCRTCRGKGFRYFCEHLSWWGTQRCDKCTGYNEDCKDCNGGGLSADEACNETAPYAKPTEAQRVAYEMQQLARQGHAGS